jgi:hypothetical protein
MALKGMRFNYTNTIQAKLWDALVWVSKGAIRAILRTVARSLGSRNKVLWRLLWRGQHWLKASAAVMWEHIEPEKYLITLCESA